MSISLFPHHHPSTSSIGQTTAHAGVRQMFVERERDHSDDQLSKENTIENYLSTVILLWQFQN